MTTLCAMSMFSSMLLRVLSVPRLWCQCSVTAAWYSCISVLHSLLADPSFHATTRLIKALQTSLLLYLVRMTFFVKGEWKTQEATQGPPEALPGSLWSIIDSVTAVMLCFSLSVVNYSSQRSRPLKLKETNWPLENLSSIFVDVW